MWNVKVGDWIIAVVLIEDRFPDGRRLVYATSGGVGHVIDLRPGYLPTIYFEATKTVCDCEPEAEFTVLCDADFGRSAPYPPRESK